MVSSKRVFAVTVALLAVAIATFRSVRRFLAGDATSLFGRVVDSAIGGQLAHLGTTPCERAESATDRGHQRPRTSEA